MSWRGLKNPDKKKGGGADLRFLLLLKVLANLSDRKDYPLIPS
jgi:hypothetical protein